MDHIHVTVAAIIKRNEHYLLVKERASNGNIVFNQPAGHVETGESLPCAIKREVKEETGLDFEPKALVGTYLLSPATNGKTYLRFCFMGELIGNANPKPQDRDIISAEWFTLSEILALKPEQLRSALVLQCLTDFDQGKKIPLDSLHFCSDEPHMGIVCTQYLRQING